MFCKKFEEKCSFAMEIGVLCKKPPLDRSCVQLSNAEMQERATIGYLINKCRKNNNCIKAHNLDS